MMLFRWRCLIHLLNGLLKCLFWIQALWIMLPPDTSCSPRSGFRPALPRRSGGRPKPAWVKEAALRLFGLSHSIRQIRDQVNRLHARQGISVGVATVYGWVKRYSHAALQARAGSRNPVPKFLPANHRWGLDLTGKGDHIILGIIDHGTRLNLTLVRLSPANTQAVIDQIDQAIDQFGTPRKLTTDNAAIFHSKAFRHAMKVRGIRHVFIPPGQPWKNGRIERFFLTLKQKLDRILPQDTASLDQLLAELRFWYNTVRPHQNLQGHTPWEAWHGINPFVEIPASVWQFNGWGGLLKGYYLRF